MLKNKQNINSFGDIPILFSSPQTIESNKTDNIKKYVDNYSLVSNITDYEKIKLTPYYEDGLVTGITFNLFLYNETSNIWDTSISTIDELGFTGDDILNKTNRLSHSFLRILYFDSNIFNSKNLLGYNILYFDLNDLYANYIKNNLNITNQPISFNLTNPLLTSGIKLFEGYNIYLYKTLFDSSSNIDIYARFEFNNALTGKSKLFNYRISQPVSGDEYNINELSDEIHMKISCDGDAKRYNYNISPVNNKVSINLYETILK